MARFIDLTGIRFGNLVVVRPTDKKRFKTMVWECQCDCGNKVEVPANYLKMGHKKSCGCLYHAPRKKIEYKGILYSYQELGDKFNVSPSTLQQRYYRGYKDDELIKGKPNHGKTTKYHDADGSPINFAELSKQTKVSRWGLMLRYKKGLRGEDLRKPSGHYVYHAGRKITVTVAVGDKQISLQELAAECGIPYKKLYNKYRYCQLKKQGKDKSYKNGLYDENGHYIDFKKLSEKSGISQTTLRCRYMRGYRGEELLMPRWKRREKNVEKQM